MKKVAVLVVILVSSIWLCAADPSGFAIWKGTTIEKSGKDLGGKIDDQKFAWESLATYDNHLIGIAHREGDGSAEIHETQADIFIVQEGTAALIVGGKMVDAKTINRMRCGALQLKEETRSRLVSATSYIFQPMCRIN